MCGVGIHTIDREIWKMCTSIVRIVAVAFLFVSIAAFCDDLSEIEAKCQEIGFERRTPAFGECVLELDRRTKDKQQQAERPRAEQQRQDQEKQKAAESASRDAGSPKNAVVAFVDTKRILEALQGRYNSVQATIKALNPMIKRFAENNNFDILFQKAVWTSPQIDVTAEFIQEVEGKSVNYERMRSFSRILPKVGFVDTKRVRRESSRGQDVEYRVISQIGEDQGFTIIFQEAVYASPGIDITSEVIRRMP